MTDNIKGVILSGSPFSVRDEHAPIPNLEGIKGVLPLLGVCYGAQHLAKDSGGEVLPSKIRNMVEPIFLLSIHLIRFWKAFLKVHKYG